MAALSLIQRECSGVQVGPPAASCKDLHGDRFHLRDKTIEGGTPISSLISSNYPQGTYVCGRRVCMSSSGGVCSMLPRARRWPPVVLSPSYCTPDFLAVLPAVCMFSKSASFLYINHDLSASLYILMRYDRISEFGFMEKIHGCRRPTTFKNPTTPNSSVGPAG